jgi:hypothetical protein
LPASIANASSHLALPCIRTSKDPRRFITAKNSSWINHYGENTWEVSASELALAVVVARVVRTGCKFGHHCADEPMILFADHSSLSSSCSDSRARHVSILPCPFSCSAASAFAEASFPE